MNIDRNLGTLWVKWGIPLFSGTRHQVLEKIDSLLIQKNEPVWVATVNPEFVMKSMSNNGFAEILMYQTDINVIDGIGLAWAKDVEEQILHHTSHTTSFNRETLYFLKKIKFGFKSGVKVLKGKLRNEIFPGCELMEELCKQASEKNESVFFLGGWNGASEQTANYFAKKYKGLNVEGWYEGSVNEDSSKILSMINGKRVQYLFISYGMKTQEDWIKMNIDKLDVGLVMGVGRSMDYFSTQLKRAPKVWQKMGFEWLYSLIKQPSRWKRQMAIWQFLTKFLFENNR